MMKDSPSDLIDSILDLPVPTDVQLSPDGLHVVYTTTQKWHHKDGSCHRKTQIWKANTSVRGSACPLTSGEWHDRSPRWSPDGISVAFLSDRASPGRSSALYMIDIGSQEAQAISQEDDEQEISAFAFSPNGDTIAFRRSSECHPSETGPMPMTGPRVWGQSWKEVRLNLLDVSSGSVKEVGNENENVTELAWNDTGTEVAFLACPTRPWDQNTCKGTTAYLFDIATHSVRRVLHLPKSASDLVWCGSHLYFLTNNILDRDTSGTAVYSMHISTSRDVGTLRKRILDSDQPCCARSIQKAGNKILVHVENGMEDQLLFLDDTFIYSQKVRVSSYCGLWARLAAAPLLALAWGDLNNPTEVFIFRSGNIVQLSNHALGTRFTSNDIGSCIHMECMTLDGSEHLDGLFITPKQNCEVEMQLERPVPLPTFVLIHGGPYSRITNCFEVWHPFHMLIPALLFSGYAVLVPNYRGSSGRGEKFASYARGGMGRFDQADIIAMVQHAITQGLADRSRLLVAGWSQGGYLAYLSAVRNGAHNFGWQFVGAVAGAGVTDWDSMTMSSDLGDFQAQLAGGSPWSSEQGDLQSRVGSAIWEFKRAASVGSIPPMLMLHGASDQRVPLAQATGFQRALDEAELPYELIIYPGEGHYLKKREHIKDMLTRVWAFTRDMFSG
ncbi:putative peptidase yuxL [Rosellinia necatrix]|uniref:Dipeptidyl-peptidase V n=1 Tax=Rosellinia necatrix TaxID=77044 RepID=A0A1W2TSV6_ROSNE|nr:putative peptidase yuxL [Rosellinia necatrix]